MAKEQSANKESKKPKKDAKAKKEEKDAKAKKNEKRYDWSEATLVSFWGVNP